MMLRSRPGLIGALLAVGLLWGACAARNPAKVALATAPVAVAAPAPVASVPKLQTKPQSDPVADLIALSTRHFENGQSELQLGHLGMAKVAFNKALEVLLESPYGARTEPTIRAHFDRLVERISAYEATALAQGDGFTEQKQFESATIDELLAPSPVTPPSHPLFTDCLPFRINRTFSNCIKLAVPPSWPRSPLKIMTWSAASINAATALGTVGRCKATPALIPNF